MQFSTLLKVAFLAASASAYTILTPTSNSTVAKGSTIDVKWTSVDTDASTFSIYLVNFLTNHWPPTVVSLAQNVAQGAGKFSVKIPCDLSSDYGWQLNFINGTNTYVIYAQSPMFTLTGNCVDAPVVTPTTYKNSTATVTATTTAIQVKETIIYNQPLVWFVQPTALVVAGAMCPPSDQKTVTVSVKIPATTIYVNAPAATGCPVGPGGSAAVPTTAVTAKTSTYGTSVPFSTGSVAKPTTTTFKGAASSVKVGGMAFGVIVGAVALLL